MGIDRMIRRVMLAVGGYTPGRSAETLADKIPAGDIIKLNANENPYGCSPRVSQALAGDLNFNIYPDAGQGELKQLLAGYACVGPENIIASHGSNQLIDDVLRLFVGPGDEVINCVPTFDLFRFRTQVCGGTVVEVRRDDSFAVDIKAIKAAITASTKLILLVTPNNPTGTVTPQEDIEAMAATGLPVLMDEAYVEFSGRTVAPLVGRYENLMVLRTFSKWAGLAGLRIGYGIFPPAIADLLMKTSLPFSVNVVAVAAVRETLKDLKNVQEKVHLLVMERERLFTKLSTLKWLTPFPSEGNFIFCSVLEGNARKIQQALQDKGILIRYFDVPLLENAIRISVGRPEHTDAVIKALQQISP